MSLIFLAGSYCQPVKAAKVRQNKPYLIYRLKSPYHVVVQKSVIGKKYIYSLQVVGKNSCILRAKKPRRGTKVKFSKKHQLLLKNFGHSQTWLRDGKNHWLVDADPIKRGKYYWDTEIARLRFPRKRETVSRLHRFPRLTNLKYATDVPAREGAMLKRAEVAITPNHRQLLIASVDIKNNGHFALYSLHQVNSLLSRAAKRRRKTVNVRKLTKLGAFHVAHLFGDRKDELNSIQGYAIDNNHTIYISEERSPSGKNSHRPRQIIKIPWGDIKPSTWSYYKITDPGWHKFATELEGLELDSGKLHLNVAFHKKSRSHPTLKNDIYRVNHVTS